MHLKSSPIMRCHGKKRVLVLTLPLSQKRETNEPLTVRLSATVSPLLIDIFTTAKTLGGFVLPQVASSAQPKAVNRPPLRKIARVKISPGATTTDNTTREWGFYLV